MELLTTSGISHQIESLIKSATSDIWLVSPYLKIHKQLLNRIIKANSKGVTITIIYGKSELNDAEWRKLNQLANANIYFCPNLHAKVFINETYGLIGSMNLYDFSQINNIELGALFYKNEDNEFYQNTLDEVTSIINQSEIKKESQLVQNSIVLTDEERIEKAKIFYSQFESHLVEFTLEAKENLVTKRKSFHFSGALKDKRHIRFSNDWGFISVWSEQDNVITDTHRKTASKIAKTIDSGNRFYNHQHANRFCVYDPKGSGVESYLDDGDAEVILAFIELLS